MSKEAKRRAVSRARRLSREARALRATICAAALRTLGTLLNIMASIKARREAA